MKPKLRGCLRSDFKLLDIGTRISYHHRAGIARYMLLHGKPSDYSYRDPPPKSGWKIIEGTLVYNGRRPESIPTDNPFEHRTCREMFFDWPQAKFGTYASYDGKYNYQTYNKTVMVWPDDGFGWIIGIMKKSLGTSSRSYGSGDNYEEGWHHSDMYVDLYVIKPWYEGVQYILCPLWAVMSVENDWS